MLSCTLWERFRLFQQTALWLVIELYHCHCWFYTVSHYKCPLCDMTCPSPSALRNHIKFRHSNEKPYSCDCCEYRYHIICSENKPAEAACTMLHVSLMRSFFFFLFFCSPRCKNLIDLRKHLDTHSSEPAFHCDIPSCSFTSRALSTMKLHHKREHEVKEGEIKVVVCLLFKCVIFHWSGMWKQGSFGARYKCHVCDKCFTRGNSLTVHLHKKHQFKWPSGHPRFR